MSEELGYILSIVIMLVLNFLEYNTRKHYEREDDQYAFFPTLFSMIYPLGFLFMPIFVVILTTRLLWRLSKRIKMYIRKNTHQKGVRPK